MERRIGWTTRVFLSGLLLVGCGAPAGVASDAPASTLAPPSAAPSQANGDEAYVTAVRRHAGASGDGLGGIASDIDLFMQQLDLMGEDYVADLLTVVGEDMLDWAEEEQDWLDDLGQPSACTAEIHETYQGAIADAEDAAQRLFEASDDLSVARSRAEDAIEEALEALDAAQAWATAAAC